MHFVGFWKQVSEPLPQIKTYAKQEAVYGRTVWLWIRESWLSPPEEYKTCPKRHSKHKHAVIKTKVAIKCKKLSQLLGRAPETLGLPSWVAPTLSKVSVFPEVGRNWLEIQLAPCPAPRGPFHSRTVRTRAWQCLWRVVASRARVRKTRFLRLNFLGEINFIKCSSSHGIPHKQLDKSAPLWAGW